MGRMAILWLRELRTGSLEMAKIVRLVLACVLLAACSEGQTDDRARRDTLTQRQRDSIIGASGLPGARAVQRAIRASDAARERTQVLDSLQR